MRKLENVLTALGAGGLIIVVTILAAFRIDFVSIGEALKQMNGLIVALIICAVILVIGLAMKITDKRVTRANVHHKVRNWLDAFGIGSTVVNWDKWHFGYNVLLPPTNVPVWIARTMDRDRYVTLIGRLRPMQPDQKRIFDQLDLNDRDSFFRKLHTELSKAQIATANNFVKNELSINKRLPIAGLTESKFVDALDAMHFSAIIVWNTVALQLKELGHTTTQPLPASDTEALPPEATSKEYPETQTDSRDC